jgi:Skp family chaperone for outer membrane proteins
MKKILFCIGFFAMMVTTVSANEIAVINLEEVLKNSTAMSKITKNLEAKKTEMEKKLKAEEQKLSGEKTTLENQLKTLSPETAQSRVSEFQEKVMAFQSNVKESEAELQKSYMDAVMKVTENIKSIVQEMKTEKNSKYTFNVVFPTASTIYHDSTIDISSEALARLNKRLKEIK